VLLVERTLTLVNEVAFGVAGVLLLAFVIVEPTRTRTWITGKQVRYGSNALAMTVVLLAILSVGNFLADRHPHRIDVTANRSLSLAPQSVDVLESLQGPVHVIVFYTSPQDRDQAADLLDQYSFHSPDMEVEFHDLEVEISAAMQWGVDEAWRPTLFILYQDRREEINVIGEREITSALVRLSREGQPVAYFLTGHGEPDLDSSGDQGLSALREQLAEEGFQAAPLNLLITSTIPSDASVVVALGPQRTMAQEEVERLAAFVDGGGAAMILLDPPFSDEEGSSALDTWLADQWSVAFRDDVVVDPAASHPRCAYPVCPVAEPSGGSVIGRGMANTGVYFIEARSITQITTTQETTDTVAASPHYLSLVQSSADSWGETSWEELAYDDEEDVAGPVDIAVTLENTESGAKLALFGDASFCTNLFVQDLWNGDLFINTLDWLTEEEELISIRPQPDVNRSVMIPSVAVYNALLVVLVVAVPLLVLGIGGVVLLVRRSRQ
jgi:ABC-type uncharacterized transport system involved in gliding motility auxiliary subunit